MTRRFCLSFVLVIVAAISIFGAMMTANTGNKNMAIERGSPPVAMTAAMTASLSEPRATARDGTYAAAISIEKININADDQTSAFCNANHIRPPITAVSTLSNSNATITTEFIDRTTTGTMTTAAIYHEYSGSPPAAAKASSGFSKTDHNAAITTTAINTPDATTSPPATTRANGLVNYRSIQTIAINDVRRAQATVA